MTTCVPAAKLLIQNSIIGFTFFPPSSRKRPASCRIIQGQTDLGELRGILRYECVVFRLPYHALKTEYYALAAGTLSDRDVRIEFPEGKHLTYKYGHVIKISPETNTVHLQDGSELFYDDLIIALGCEDKYHNIPGAQEFTYSIQTLEESRKTQQAIYGLSPESVVSIVGAGLSGVELASELHESRKDLTIRLFDRGPSVLSFLSDKVSSYVQEWFEEHDVEVINNSNVTLVTADDVRNGDDTYPSDLTIWTAGTQPVKVVRDLGFAADQIDGTSSRTGIR